MGWEAWLVCAIVVWLIVALAKEVAPPDLLALTALTVLLLAQVITGTELLPSTKTAIAEFGNTGLVTVAALFVVVAGLTQTGAMNLFTEPLLGRPRSLLAAQLRLLIPITAISGFLNNTPVVAMFMPIVDDICKKMGFSPSKVYVPMAYAATLGGVCTLIGTSTNLIVNGKLLAALDANGQPYPPIGFFELSYIGIPCAIAGVAYLIIASRWLLPDRRPPISLSDDPRQYTVEMLVPGGGSLVGKTVEQAGLRHLPGLFLAEIERDGEIMPAVSPRERLLANDRLVFVGILESVVDLRKMRGLTPATDQLFKVDAPETQRCLMEAVVSNRCPMAGKTIREGRFRSTYNAAVLAVARSGKKIAGKIGDIVLQPGDTLLIEGHSDFARQHRNSNDFFLVSHVENSSPPRHNRAWLALGIMVAMVLSASVVGADFLLPAALAAGLIMMATGCCTVPEARQSLDWSVLFVIGATLGIGLAIETSGAGRVIATSLIGMAGENPWVQLAIVYFLTMVLTELVTNNAAAALMFPLAMETTRALEVNHVPFVIAVMIGASAGFATPFGYQTNMMVYGPGGYRFWDYVRFGVPLDILMMVVTVAMAPFIWPFH
jgi:di/tricarboxylate transporter